MLTLQQSIQGISKITEGYNPATWMLEVSNTSQEAALGIDFAQLYKNSDLYKYVYIYIYPNISSYNFLLV